MALPDRELRHCSLSTSLQRKLWDRKKMNRRLLFRSYFCACFFFPLWNTSYCFSILQDFWLNDSFLVCWFFILVFWQSMVFYREGVVYCGCSALQVWIAHIWGEKSGASAADFVFHSQVVVCGLRKSISLIARELAECVSQQTEHRRLD